jgi:hypothetical protein
MIFPKIFSKFRNFGEKNFEIPRYKFNRYVLLAIEKYDNNYDKN